MSFSASASVFAKPELLSPAGSPEAFEAALSAGADAIYLGAERFGARAYAKNFTHGDIISAVGKAHKRGARVYVTVNTLITDRELPDAMSLSFGLYEAGVDAVIAADIGYISLLRKYLPDFEVHASTQMGCHNIHFAEYAKSLGIPRVVLARETSLEDIRYFTANTDIETEVFVHGALCVCHSGQCLLSSVIGGRSGNRGECAQPCRMKYGSGYPLSLKDLCAAGRVKELIDAGVSSFKIEGRMKSPDYVAYNTALYRRLIDENRNATEEEIAESAEVFSRDGFTTGYLDGVISKEMLGVRREDEVAKKVNRAGLKNPANRGEEIFIKRQAVEDKDGIIKEIKKLSRKKDTKSKKLISGIFYDKSQIPEDTSFFDVIYLPLEKFSAGTGANGVSLPPVIFDREEKEVFEKLKEAFCKGASHVLCHQVWQADFVKKAAEEAGLQNPVIHCSHRAGIYSNITADEICKYGFYDITLSPELLLPAMRDISYRKSVIVYGALPVMTLEKPVGFKSLTDRTGATFPILREGGRDILYNSQPIYEADREDLLKEAGIFNRVFIFSTETKGEVKKVIEEYKNHLPRKNAKITRIKKQR